MALNKKKLNWTFLIGKDSVNILTPSLKKKKKRCGKQNVFILFLALKNI